MNQAEPLIITKIPVNPNRTLYFALTCFLALLPFAYTLLPAQVSPEVTTGTISSGSLVKTRTTKRLALVTEIQDGSFAQIYPLNQFNEPSRPRSAIPIKFLLDVSPPPFDLSEFTAETAWPFWNVIKQTPWYTQKNCHGPLFCTDGRHHCHQAAPTYFEIIRHFRSPAHNIRFQYNGVDFRRDKHVFMDYVRGLISKANSRLYFVNLAGMHVFMIEQFGVEFRIYQSIQNSFDLEFWTDPTISINSMCEPGMTVSEALMDAGTRPLLTMLGVQDDSETIVEAKEKFGCLKSIPVDQIEALFMALSFGFELEHIKRERGVQSLIPYFHENVKSHNDTKFWLGKSAVSLYKMFRQPRTHFNIFLSFMDFPR